MERITLFVDVLLPVPVHTTFTYRVPFDFNEQIAIGLRVIVPFGKSKFLTGIVVRVHEKVPEGYQAKYVEHILDAHAIVNLQQLKFWHWLATYYMAPIGDVVNAALPSNFKLASETKILLHPEFSFDHHKLSDRESDVVELLKINEQIDLSELGKVAGVVSVVPFLKKLIEKQIVITVDEINQKYTPKTILVVCLHPNLHEEDALQQTLMELEASPRTEKQVEALIEMIKRSSDLGGLDFPVPKKDLVEAGISPSTIQTLEKKDIFIVDRYQIDRLKIGEVAEKTMPILTPPQKTALEEIRSAFEEKQVVLLNGVTGAGKTEIYVQLIQEALDNGKQVLFLLPEIALTTQLIQRLKKFFGDLVGIYHSRFNQNERVEIWNKVLENAPHRYRIIVGARSSIFLPFIDLGLIIVDEEHETSYKQQDPSPRYNGRDAAIYLGALHKAKVLLGTATPSIETQQNALQGKFGLVNLTERYQGMEMPEIVFADLKRERKLGTMLSHFSELLMKEMDEKLKNGEQIILFQNRRGYTPYWTCEVCSNSPKCVNCDVHLTYHKHSNTLKCHYCGYGTPPIGTCSSCGSNRIVMMGFGTEKIEDELRTLFPNHNIKRLDLDTTRSKNAYEEILEDFDNQRIHILVGTQMITKGLDFDNVGLVGVLDADNLLKRPDFRANERAFQLFSQVAGRAGRKGKQGRVIIQTTDPENWVLGLIQKHDYTSFFNHELIERRNYYYPPFFKLIHITLKHKEENKLVIASVELTGLLQDIFKERVIGPEKPTISRINNYFLRQIYLKYEKEVSDKTIKETVANLLNKFYEKPVNKAVKVIVDVDPI